MARKWGCNCRAESLSRVAERAGSGGGGGAWRVWWGGRALKSHGPGTADGGGVGSGGKAATEVCCDRWWIREPLQQHGGQKERT